MMYGSWDMKFNRQTVFVILGNFLPFYPLTPWKMKISKMKKNPGHIIILHKCTKNYDHLLYCSRDMAHDGCNWYFHFGLYFSLLHPNSPKNENFKTMIKKPGDIILPKCTKNHDHMLCCFWDMARVGCNCYFSFWAIFSPFTPYQPKKWTFHKNEKTIWRYHHLKQVHQKSWSYALLFLRYGTWRM